MKVEKGLYGEARALLFEGSSQSITALRDLARSSDDPEFEAYIWRSLGGNDGNPKAQYFRQKASAEIAEEEGRWGGCARTLVRHLGFEVLHVEDVGDYQGDIGFLLRHGGLYGFVNIGYGSCEYCDYLSDFGDDLDAARDDVFPQIDWQSSAQALYNRIVPERTSWGHETRAEIAHWMVENLDVIATQEDDE